MLQGLATITAGPRTSRRRSDGMPNCSGSSRTFERRGPDDRLAYAKFRVGAYQHELGLVDRRWAPSGA
jgi:hypothetical protein